MKIGFFSESYKPYVSGVVKSIESFKNQFKEKGHKVYIFAPDYPEARPEDNVFRIKSFPALTHPDFRLPLTFFNKIRDKIKSLQLDIIHTHSPFLAGWLAKYVSQKLNIPLVFTYHTLYEKYSHYAPIGKLLAKKITIKYTKKYCEYCDLIIAPSNYVKKKLQERDILNRILTVPTGIELSLYENKDTDWIQDKYKIDEEEKILLFVGRLGKEKNIDFLLKSFQKISNKIDNVRLMIVGEGPYKKNLESLRDNLGIEKKVIFTGLQPYNKVIDFYLYSDLFVFPSLTETQGLVILEAMAGGLPVVAVDAGGVTAMIDQGENGILVRENINQFVRAVVKILSDEKEYRVYCQNAVKKAAGYSISRMADKLLQGYRDILYL
ncbi:MAG: glycosyltransferase family 4 protein [Halanaerobiales bacterium]